MWTQSSLNFLRSSAEGITRVDECCLSRVNQIHNEVSPRHQAKIEQDGRVKGGQKGKSIAKIVSVIEINGIALTIRMNQRVIIRFPGESGIMPGRFSAFWWQQAFDLYKRRIRVLVLIRKLQY